MKHLALPLSLLLVLALALPALAGPPLPGVYKTTDLGGPISTGRYTEGWEAGGGALLPGTTLNAESWDGVALGTEWKYWCATTQAPATLLSDTVDGNGNGARTYMKMFTGGLIWLSGTGPWANGDPDYPGNIQSYIEYETIQYLGGVEVAAITNVQATATFAAYPNTCLTFYVSNGALIGSTEMGMTKPADYPAFLQAGTCDPVLTEGAWWNMLTMTLTISADCATPARPMTWGSLKSLHD